MQPVLIKFASQKIKQNLNIFLEKNDYVVKSFFSVVAPKRAIAYKSH